MYIKWHLILRYTIKKKVKDGEGWNALVKNRRIPLSEVFYGTGVTIKCLVVSVTIESSFSVLDL